jgi:hypothetical protein
VILDLECIVLGGNGVINDENEKQNCSRL